MSNSSSPIKKRSRGEDAPDSRDRDRDSSDRSNSHSNNGSSAPKKISEDGDDNKDGGIERKEEAHLAARSELLAAQQQLPFQAGNIKVLDFGTLRPSSPAFHSPVSLFPVGYKSEVTVEHRESPFRPSSKEVVLCEVLEVDDQPEFVLTVQSSGRVFIAPSEDGVWKKVREAGPALAMFLLLLLPLLLLAAVLCIASP
jgi:hypothetical protein